MSNIKLDFQPEKLFATKGTLVISIEDQTTPLQLDTLDISNCKKRKQFVEEVAKKHSGIDAEELEQSIMKHAAKILANRNKASKTNEDNQQDDPLEHTSDELKDSALELLKSDKLFDQIARDIGDIGVAGEEKLVLLLYLIMTSRLLDKPLSAIVQGASASGKSFIIETVAKLMPPEALLQAHDFSDQALYYLPPGSLEHKIVISGERIQNQRGKDGFTEDNTKAFREMVASNELRKAVTIKGADGKFKTIIIQQKGPISYLENTTANNIHDEDATRILPLSTDESSEQTQKVIENQRLEAKGQIISESRKLEIIQRHHTMQRLLKPIQVRIPFIDSISLPENSVATRRTYQQLISVIRAVAFLKQYQKVEKTDDATGQKYIEADEIDYARAYDLMNSVLARKYSSLNQQSHDLLCKIRDNTKDNGNGYFTQADCEKWCGVSNSTVRRRLKPLIFAGVVLVDEGNKPYRYKVEHPELADHIDLKLSLPGDIAERVAIMSE